MVKEIVNLRKKINKLDSKLIKILEKRFAVCKKIGKYKSKRGILILDKKREKEIIKNLCKKTNFSRDFVKKLFCLILGESKKLQKNLK